MSETLHVPFSYQKMFIQELIDEEQELVRLAKETTGKTYSKYSGYNVGASVLLQNGEYVFASNQENAAYPNGHCAESIACSYAGSFYKDKNMVAIAVAARQGESDSFQSVSPCGKCRQVMLEYELKQRAPIKILMVINDHEVLCVESVSYLLPICFSNDMMTG